MEGHERMWLEALEADFDRLLGPPAAGRLVRPERLLIALRRLDRYADFGAGRLGVGVEIARQLLEAHAAHLADELDEWNRERCSEAAQRERAAPRRRPQPPRHLGYFVPELIKLGRKWRRAHRPRRHRARAERAQQAIQNARVRHA